MMGTSHLTMTNCSVSNNAIRSANFPLLFADYFGKVSRDAWSGGVGSLGLDRYLKSANDDEHRGACVFR